MTRTEVLQRISELMDKITALQAEPASPLPVVNEMRQTQIEQLTEHRKDLQLIYYMHLYKLA